MNFKENFEKQIFFHQIELKLEENIQHAILFALRTKISFYNILFFLRDSHTDAMVKAVAKTTSAKAGGPNKWLNYLKSFREKNNAKTGSAKTKQSEILKEAGRLWKAMSEAEKEKFATPSDGPTKK